MLYSLLQLLQLSVEAASFISEGPFPPFFEKGLPIECCMFQNTSFWRRAVGRQGVREIVLALLVPRVIVSGLQGFRQPLPRLLPPFKM